MSSGTIIEVDPSTLTIAPNVRADVRLDKEFVASIKEHGVLQPPMVVAAEGGGYDVVLGQRRSLAASQAGLKTIPVYLVEKDEADAARIVDQLTENDQRQQLMEAERVGGYKELALLGLSPADIVKRTSTPKARVTAALAVADSEAAIGALREFPITLDQAAEIVEFEDDAEAVERLTEAAQKNPGAFAHVVSDLRTRRALAEQRIEVEAAIEAEGVTLLPYSEQTWQTPEGYERIGGLGTIEDASVMLERADVAKNIQGARAIKNYRDGEYVIEAEYFISVEHHSYPRKVYAGTVHQLTDEEKAQRAEREADQRAHEEKRAARNAAAEVRTAWIVDELLQRSKLPDPTTLLAVEITWGAMLTYEEKVDLDLLGWIGVQVPTPEDDSGELEVDELSAGQFLREQLAANQKLGPKVVIAALLFSIERDANGWQEPEPTHMGPYFEQLAEWGYGLSDYERAVVDSAKTGSADA